MIIIIFSAIYVFILIIRVIVVNVSRRITYSIRDFLLWSDFMNVTEHLPLDQSFVRGALLVFIDKIGIAESITVR